MSTQDIRQLSTVLRSIEIIEEKTNILYNQYLKSTNENDNVIDDTNIHLQTFFQHLEQLLQTDLKNRKSLLNNSKRNYWNFFAAALKESKGLYDTILFVINSQEVKTSTGRGRLFLRFCLQNHRLGDVIQQSFMMGKIVNQFYLDECFWSTPIYLNRIIQALYQLNDLQFDLLSNSQYQLDVSWPTSEPIDIRPKTLSDAAIRIRNSSVSSFLSMNSVDSQSIISILPDFSTSSSIATPIFQNVETSTNNNSLAQSVSSTDEDIENTLNYWKDKCHQLETQLQERQTINHTENPSSVDENIQTDIEIESKNTEIIEQFNDENEQLKNHINLLKEEINNLNSQTSSISIQHSTTTNKIKDFENDLNNYKTLIENKEILINQLQEKFNEQTEELQRMQEEYSSQSNEQIKQIELLQIELEKLTKSFENQNKLIDNERTEHNKIQQQLEVSLNEKALDFEEMKRRLIKAVREKAELFNSIHSYEIKLEEEQSKKWVADEDVLNCTKCNTLFGWTVRKHHCRHCQRIFCYHCSNNWISGPKSNSPQYRVCDFCNDILLKESLLPNGATNSDFLQNHETTDDVDLHFEVRAERLLPTADTQPTS